jgi:hypothetical protein
MRAILMLVMAIAEAIWTGDDWSDSEAAKGGAV